MCTGAVAGFRLASGNGGWSWTTGAGATPGATMNVSLLNRPTNLPAPRPSSLVTISPWYHAKPNGAFGTWITKNSNSVSGGKPLARTFMISTGPIDVILTRALASGRHPAASAPADRTMLNRIVLGSPAPRAANGVVTAARTTAVDKISLHLLQIVRVPDTVTPPQETELADAPPR